MFIQGRETFSVRRSVCWSNMETSSFNQLIFQIQVFYSEIFYSEVPSVSKDINWLVVFVQSILLLLLLKQVLLPGRVAYLLHIRYAALFLLLWGKYFTWSNIIYVVNGIIIIIIVNSIENVVICVVCYFHLLMSGIVRVYIYFWVAVAIHASLILLISTYMFLLYNYLLLIVSRGKQYFV